MQGATETPKRKLYIAIGALIVLSIFLVAVVGSGGYLIYKSINPSDNTENNDDTINPLTTTNEAQLCPTKPSGSQLNYRGEEIYPIPDWIVENMIMNGTWHEGCPVPITDLTLLSIPYWNCDKKDVEFGQMIVNVNVSSQVLTVFNQLLVSGYPIYKMNLMYTYGGDDDAAMADNNTSSFNCRPITDQPGTWSLHSYGTAVDVNTLVNPYVNGDQILPPEGAVYVNRSIVVCRISIL